MLRSELILVPLIAAVLACHAPATTMPEAQTETAASSERMPAGARLLVSYASNFYLFGLGRDYADALLELPPEHPAWADLHSLLDAAWEASDQAAVDAYAHALAEHQNNTYLTAESLFLYMREADRNRDWARGRCQQK